MRKPPNVIEIFLQPGELWFGDEHTRIRTLLGSCVAVTLWHPLRRIGGMCHYLLPVRERPPGSAPDGRYATEALEVLLAEIRKVGAQPQEFEAKLFGGGHMFPPLHRDARSGGVGLVHDRNVEMALALVDRHGFLFKAKHLGGDGHRNIIFDLWSGHVWMRHFPLTPGAPGGGEEKAP